MTTQVITKIIYINLSHRKDRRDLMEGQLSKLDIPYERFCAIQPTTESLNIGGKYNSFYVRSKSPKQMQYNSPHMRLASTPSRAVGEFGCYLSHYFIHKKAHEEMWANYLILEDDCKLNAGWLELVNEYVGEGKVPNDWDMIRSLRGELSTKKVERFDSCNRQSKFSTNKIHNTISGGTHFQICKGKSSQKIVNHLESDYVYNIDSVYSTNKLNVYYSKFNVEQGSLGSDILYRDN